MTNHVRKRHQESILLFLQPQSLPLPEAILSDRLKSPDLICYLLFNNKKCIPTSSFPGPMDLQVPYVSLDLGVHSRPCLSLLRVCLLLLFSLSSSKAAIDKERTRGQHGTELPPGESRLPAWPRRTPLWNNAGDAGNWACRKILL